MADPAELPFEISIKEWWLQGWRRPILKRRKLLWEMAGRKCHWCGKPTRLCSNQVHDQATIDHIIPRYKGGTDLNDNLVSACYQCNSRRNSEDMKGLPEGALLGKNQPVKPNGTSKYRVALTGDEKKALFAKPAQPAPVIVPLAQETLAVRIENLANQRDQMVAEVFKLRNQVAKLEQELDHLRFSFWRRFRVRLGHWLIKS